MFSAGTGAQWIKLIRGGWTQLLIFQNTTQYRAQQNNHFHLFTQTPRPDLAWIRETLKIAQVYFCKRQNEGYKSVNTLWNPLHCYNNILTAQVGLFKPTDITFKTKINFSLRVSCYGPVFRSKRSLVEGTLWFSHLHFRSRTEHCLILLQSSFHLSKMCLRERPRPTLAKKLIIISPQKGVISYS